MTKQFENYVANYDKATCDSVKNAYGKCSIEKYEIECDIKKDMERNNGTAYKICSHNGYYFTCGYTFIKEGVKYLKYYTPKNTYIIKLD